jgi:hypothetical protein
MQDKRAIYPTLNRDLARLRSAHSNATVAAWRHTQFPIEGAGVVHVVTELPDSDPDYGYADITLARYANGDLVDHIPLTGSVGEGALAGFMHEHWCNLGRLIGCVQGNTKALFILDIDWEIEDDDDDEELSRSQKDNSEHPDPGLTSRIVALIDRAESNHVHVRDLDTLRLLV